MQRRSYVNNSANWRNLCSISTNNVKATEEISNRKGQTANSERINLHTYKKLRIHGGSNFYGQVDKSLKSLLNI
jgi:hypothetical protein